MSDVQVLITQEGAHIPPIKRYKDKFEGHVIVVTGAAQGIGAVTATTFALQGGTVVLVDLNEDKLNEVCSKLSDEGARVIYRVCDLTKEAAVIQTIDSIVSTLGKVDVLAHVAGIYPFSPILQQSTEVYHKIFSVNMDSTFYLIKSVLPHMNRAGYGRIITTTSGVTFHPQAGLSTYAAAKNAVAAFTRTTAFEAGPGVTANSVSPGLVYNESTLTNPDSRAIFHMHVGRQAVRRYGLPRDVADTICFIASPEAEFLTGQNVDIGGGWTHGA